MAVNAVWSGTGGRDVTFEITQDNTEQIIQDIDTRLSQLAQEIGIHLEGEAKLALENRPIRVDTGRLRNSITHGVGGGAPAISTYQGNLPGKSGRGDTRPPGRYSGTFPEDRDGEKTVYVGTNCEYAEYVHEGSLHSAANRFLKNAVERNADQIKRKINEALGR